MNFDNLKLALLSKVLEMRYAIHNVLSRRSLPEEADVVVSLTTYHERIATVYLTIESLIDQDCATPYRVELWLSREDISEEELPIELVRLRERGVSIMFVNTNYKSYKKLVHAYDRHQAAAKVHVTADDDVFYPRYWLRGLLDVHAKHPREVVCYRAHELHFDARGKVLPYAECVAMGSQERGASLLLVPTGVSGVLYPPEALSREICNSSLFLEYCPSADDLWFKFVTAANGCPVRRVFAENRHFIPIRSSRKSGLMLENLEQRGNDRAIQMLSAHLGFDELVKATNGVDGASSAPTGPTP